MKTFKQFLSEAETKDLVEFLRANCRQVLRDFSQADRFLWRGIKKPKKLQDFTFEEENFRGFIDAPRQDRRPLNTPEWAHQVFNEFFTEKFGEPLRSTTLFAVGTPRKAFGSSAYHFAILPMQDYEIYWSPKVEDLTTYAFPTDEELEKSSSEERKADLLKLLKAADYQKGSISEALQSSSELMVKCKNYLALKITEIQLKKIIQVASE